MDVAVAGRLRDFPVESEIGVDAAVFPFLFAAHAVEMRLDQRKLFRSPPGGRQCRSFGLENAAQFEQPLHVAGILQRLAVDADHRTLLRRQHESANPLARLNEPVSP